MSAPLILLAALSLDAVIGDPKWLWSKIPHPAVMMGNTIAWMDRSFNNGEHRKITGAVVLIILCLVGAIIGVFLQNIPDYGFIEILVVTVLLAQKSLVDHVIDVANSLDISLQDGRQSVAKIVGRDTKSMNESSVARSAIESAAENLSDGIVAPVFWFLVLGLPGMLIYKFTNTADSMIGYKTERHRDFGWAAARFDDVLNWIPARLTAALIALTSGAFSAGKIILRDAPLHRSPNAGWPEAAMAKTLEIALSGPRSYHGKMIDFPYVYPEGRKALGQDDIKSATGILWRVWGALVALAMILAMIG